MFNTRMARVQSSNIIVQFYVYRLWVHRHKLGKIHDDMFADVGGHHVIAKLSSGELHRRSKKNLTTIHTGIELYLTLFVYTLHVT